MKKETAAEIVGRALRGEPYVPTGDEDVLVSAQPAAPQGVAYAELPTSYTGSVLSSGRPDAGYAAKVTFTFNSVADAEAWHEAIIEPRGRASNGQAPATQQAGVSLRRIERTTFPSSPAHRVLSAFCGAMSDSGIDGADMRAAMLWFLGYEETYATPTAQAAPAAMPVLVDAERQAAARRDPSLAAYWRNHVVGLVEEFTTDSEARFLADRIVGALYDLPLVGVERPAPAAGAITGHAMPAEFLRSVIALCTQRGYSPENIEAWSKDDKWVADLWRKAEQMLAAAPTPAAQADSVQGLQPVHDAVTIELLNERVAYLEGKLKEADSVLEDAARWQAAEAMVEDVSGGDGHMVIVMTRNAKPEPFLQRFLADKIDVLRAARKQGDTHD